MVKASMSSFVKIFKLYVAALCEYNNLIYGQAAAIHVVGVTVTQSHS